MSREQPQVNPWPGQVRPALPPTGPSGSGRSPAQRTSDVAGTRSGPEFPAAPAVVGLPLTDDQSRRASTAPEVALPEPVAPPQEVVLRHPDQVCGLSSGAWVLQDDGEGAAGGGALDRADGCRAGCYIMGGRRGTWQMDVARL